VEQIDTNLHTDLMNEGTRKQFAEDVRKAGHGIVDIIDDNLNNLLNLAGNKKNGRRIIRYFMVWSFIRLDKEAFVDCK
jgi:hypothetical protein